MTKRQKRFTLSLSKGFTLIELLVVIAIIGILATIVMVSLNTARTKGADATVKSNLRTITTQAELVYDSASPNSYVTVCDDATVKKALAAAGNAGGGTAACYGSAGSATAWAAASPYKNSGGTAGFWCVDSAGNNAYQAATLALNDVACP